MGGLKETQDKWLSEVRLTIHASKQTLDTSPSTSHNTPAWLPYPWCLFLYMLLVLLWAVLLFIVCPLSSTPTPMTRFSLLTHSAWTLQMSLAVLSLIFTIKTFSVVPRSGHVNILIA